MSITTFQPCGDDEGFESASIQVEGTFAERPSGKRKTRWATRPANAKECHTGVPGAGGSLLFTEAEAYTRIVGSITERAVPIACVAVSDSIAIAVLS